MESPRFRDHPVSDIVELHFIPDEQQMSDWLNSLANYEQSIAIEKILQVTRALETLDIKTSLKIKFLQKIHPHLTKIVKNLQKSYLDASHPLTDSENHNIEIVVWSYMQLARLWRNCKLKYNAINKDQQAWLLYCSLEALAYALLHISLSYKQPMHGFWSFCYELYARAEQAHLTQISITRDGINTHSIGKLFKHILIFHLCDTQQFRNRDMLMLFENLTEFSAEAGILSNYQPQWQPVVCVFNLNMDIAPQKINPNDSRDDLSERFITTVIVAKSIYHNLQIQHTEQNTLRSINHETMMRALNSLGLARKRKFTRIAEQAYFSGIIGLNSLIHYLQLQNPELIKPSTSTEKSSAPHTEKKKAQLNLIPLGEEFAYQVRNGREAELKHSEQLHKLFNFTDTSVVPNPVFLDSDKSQINNIPSAPELCLLEILDSSAKGYGVITKLPATQVKIGDIIAILAQKANRIEVGTVRRINQLSDQHVKLGIEVIGFESDLVFVSHPKDNSQGFWGIFMPGVKSLKQADSLLFNSSLFKQGDTVSIKGKSKKQLFQFHKIIQISSASTHMELIPVSAEPPKASSISTAPVKSIDLI